jgi:16S rRNA processing protein RimM
MSRTVIRKASIDAAGSPSPGEPAYLAVGKLRHAHGVHGEILMEVYTDFPERLKPGVVLFLGPETGQLKLVKRRNHLAGLLLTFDGYTSPEAVGELRNQVVYLRADDRPPLADGEYYHHQLIDLTVISDEGLSIGPVTEIIETGANDVLVVRPGTGPEVLIPVANAFIQRIDLDKREIIVHIIPGMLAEEP